MLDLAEALEKYTVVQLIAALPLMFMIWLIIREMNSVVRGGKPAQTGSAAAIGNMAQAVVEISSHNEATSIQLTNAATIQNKATIILERAVLLIAKSNDKADINKSVIGDLVTKQDGANKAVTIMNKTVDEQTKDIKSILEAIVRLDVKVSLIGSKFDVLGTEIQSTKTELEIIKSDVSNLKPIEEAPKAKPAGVPVTPKPESGKEKTDG